MSEREHLSDTSAHLICVAIVRQAADDWEKLCKKVRKTGELSPQINEYNNIFTFEEIRRFFRSGLATSMLGVDKALYVLDKLEEDRLEAIMDWHENKGAKKVKPKKKEK
jgi:hypothetical protein